MARTRNTASKATGAPAPRRVRLPGQAVAQSRTARSSTGRGMLAEPLVAAVSISTNTRSSARGGRPVGPIVVNGGIGVASPTVSISLSTRLSADPIFLVDDEVEEAGEGERIHNAWCCMCRNGNKVVECDSCPRVFCHGCIKFPPEALTKDARFTCPHCHIFSGEGGKRQDVATPYKGLSTLDGILEVTGVSQTRQMLPVSDARPLMIICIRLDAEEFNPVGLPSTVFYHHIFDHLRSSVELIDMPFNFLNQDGEEKYARKVDKLVKGLTTGAYKRFRRFSVYIVDHSDPERGDLHIAPANASADGVVDVLNALLPKRLMDVLAQGDTSNNLLTFLTCGGVIEKCFDDVRTYVMQSPFSWSIAFAQKDFQPSLLHTFLSETGIAWFINGRGVMAGLRDHQAAGVHSHFLIFYPSGHVDRYAWSHPALRPFGSPTPFQCQHCGCIKAWASPKVKLMDQEPCEVTLKCRSCQKCIKYRKPKGLVRCSQAAYVRSERGDWYRQEVTQASK